MFFWPFTCWYQAITILSAAWTWWCFETLQHLCSNYYSNHICSFLLALGETGIGKSTLMDTLFNTNFDSKPSSHNLPGVKLKANTYGKCVCVCVCVCMCVCPCTVHTWTVVIKRLTFWNISELNLLKEFKNTGWQNLVECSCLLNRPSL